MPDPSTPASPSSPAAPGRPDSRAAPGSRSSRRPSSRTNPVGPAPELAAVIEDLRRQGVDAVRISYPDLIGVDRGRYLLLTELPGAVEHGLGFCRAIFHTSPQGDVVPVHGGLDAGLPDIVVHPDLATLAPLPWEPHCAWAIGDVTGTDGQPHPESPRVVLARVERQLAGAGLHALVGPELEYYLCEPDGSGPDGSGSDGSGLGGLGSAGSRPGGLGSDGSGPGGFGSAGSRRGWRRYADAPGNVYVVGTRADPRRHLLPALRMLRDAGLPVTAANHEFDGGQFEVNLSHASPLAAADQAFRLKSAVQEIAGLDGLLATFMAKPFNHASGSGFHLHLSLLDGAGRNTLADPAAEYGLSELARHAIGGVLAHAEALSALLNPTVNSYKRLGPDTLAPWLVDWGLDNRSALIRIPPERGEATRLEVRLADAAANPYLAIAATLAAIHLGVRDRLTPPPALTGYGYDRSAAPELPRRLPDALSALERDSELREVLGEEFCQAFLTFKQHEVARFERHVTDWEFREYAHHL